MSWLSNSTSAPGSPTGSNSPDATSGAVGHRRFGIGNDLGSP